MSASFSAWGDEELEGNDSIEVDDPHSPERRSEWTEPEWLGARLTVEDVDQGGIPGSAL